MMEQMATPAQQGHLVLVVDDTEDLRMLVADALRKLGGYKVETAVDGIQGLQRYFEVHPDCVVIDIKMPGLDGYQLIRALRGDPTSAGTPLIVVSALVGERDRLAGMLSGADEYLLKPVSLPALIETVRRVIGRSEDERSERQQALLDSLPPEGTE
jgi:two-component system alkaline phosphatase synthesis response regulator PhoP